MKGEWVQSASGTWHLLWPTPSDGAVIIDSWCDREFRWDDPVKHGAQLGYEDVLHDECVRKAETL